MIASHYPAASSPLGNWNLKQQKKATQCISGYITPVTCLLEMKAMKQQKQDRGKNQAALEEMVAFSEMNCSGGLVEIHMERMDFRKPSHWQVYHRREKQYKQRGTKNGTEEKGLE